MSPTPRVLVLLVLPATLLLAGPSGCPPPSCRSGDLGFVDVKKCGAVGDGVADDFTAIRNALVEAITRGGQTVYFPPGVYAVSSPIVLQNANASSTKNWNVRLLGEDPSVSIIKPHASFTNDTQHRSLIWAGITADWASNPAAAEQIRGIQIENLGVDGEHLAEPDHGIFASGVIDLLIRNCHVRRTASAGIRINQTQGANEYVRIEDNLIEDVGAWGIYLARVRDFQVTGNRVITSGFHGIIVGTTNPGADFSARGVIARNYVNRAIPATVPATGADAGFLIGIGTGVEDTVLRENVAVDNRNTGGADGLGWGYAPGEKVWRNIIIDGNQIALAGGFGLDVPSNSIVSDNVVTRPASHGILVGNDIFPANQNAVIAGNTVADPNEPLAGAPNPAIIKCIFANLTEANAETEECGTAENLLIADNICHDSRLALDGTPESGNTAGIQITAREVPAAQGYLLKARIQNLIVTANQVEGVTTAPIRWNGDKVRNLVIRDNTAAEAVSSSYTGTVALGPPGAADELGKAEIVDPLLPGANPGEELDLSVLVSRRSAESSTQLGVLAARYEPGTIAIRSHPVDGAAVAGGDASEVLWEVTRGFNPNVDPPVDPANPPPECDPFAHCRCMNPGP